MASELKPSSPFKPRPGTTDAQIEGNISRLYWVEKILLHLQTLACHSHQLSSNSHPTLVLLWPGHDSWENSHTNSRLSTLINFHATPVRVWPGHESWENSHTNSRLSTLINSCSRLTRTWKLRKLSYKLSLVNSHQLLFSLTRTWELRKFSYKLSLFNSHQLLFSFDQDMRIEKTLIQTLACQLSSTLMQLLFSFDQDMRVEKTLIQTHAYQLSPTSHATLCSRLTRTGELTRHLYNIFTTILSFQKYVASWNLAVPPACFPIKTAPLLPDIPRVLSHNRASTFLLPSP